MYLSVFSLFEKYVLTVQCIHNSWKWTYIMVIGNCDSRMSYMWQYLISSQTLHGCTLNTEFLFDNRYWHAVEWRYKQKLLSRIWSVLDTLKVMLYPLCDRNFVGQCDGSVLTHNGIFDIIQCIFSLFRNSLRVKNGPCTPSETSKSSYKFKKNVDALQRYKNIKSKK